MNISFFKYQGTGNDFIVIDNRLPNNYTLSTEFIANCCDRKFGIGADGLMLLQNRKGYDFEMIYYNANGKLGSMCGNGGRCIVAFANYLGIVRNNKTHFLAVDGAHEARINQDGLVELKMIDVAVPEYDPGLIFLDTGSPHHIEFVPQIKDFDVYSQGKKIRNSDRYIKEGTNVNFVEVIGNCSISVATFERGVEDETLSCGTGVTAAAIAYYLRFNKDNKTLPVSVKTKGGALSVRFNYSESLFSDIWLSGPAVQVFSGLVVG